MVLFHTRKQNGYLTLSQLYQHFESPKRKSRDFFQNTIEQLSSKSYEIGISLVRVRDKGILTLENFSLILIHPSPFEVSSGLIRLHDSNILNPVNKKALEKHNCPAGIALVLSLLQSVKLLTAKNRDAIQEKKDPYSVANVLFKLYYADLFTQKNFDHVLAHPDLISLYNSLRSYDRSSLTQIIFEKLMQFQQEKNSLSYAANGLKKLSILAKPIYHCSHDANFFSPHTHLDRVEFNKSNRQIFKK